MATKSQIKRRSLAWVDTDAAGAYPFANRARAENMPYCQNVNRVGRILM